MALDPTDWLPQRVDDSSGGGLAWVLALLALFAGVALVGAAVTVLLAW